MFSMWFLEKVKSDLGNLNLIEENEESPKPRK